MDAEDDVTTLLKITSDWMERSSGKSNPNSFSEMRSFSLKNWLPYMVDYAEQSNCTPSLAYFIELPKQMATLRRLRTPTTEGLE